MKCQLSVIFYQSTFLQQQQKQFYSTLLGSTYIVIYYLRRSCGLTVFAVTAVGTISVGYLFQKLFCLWKYFFWIKVNFWSFVLQYPESTSEPQSNCNFIPLWVVFKFESNIWSANSSYNPTIPVRIPLKFTVLLCKLIEKERKKPKDAGMALVKIINQYNY